MYKLGANLEGRRWLERNLLSAASRGLRGHIGEC